MNIKDLIEDCKLSLINIEKFYPEPFYVDKFFLDFLESSRQVLQLIISDASTTFGLFIKGNISIEKFREIALAKNDKKALEFLEWFQDRISEEYQFPNARFMLECIKKLENKQKPIQSKIFLTNNEITQSGICYPLDILLKNGKIANEYDYSKTLENNIPIYLEIINEKRKSKSEAKISKNDISVCVLIEQNSEYFDVLECSRIFLSILNEIIQEARSKAKNLTSF